MANNNTNGKIKITLVKSTIACLDKQKKTVEALGLKKIGSSKVFEDSPCLQGQIAKVAHLVKAESAE